MEIPRPHTPADAITTDATERMNILDDQLQYNVTGNFDWATSQHYQTYPEGRFPDTMSSDDKRAVLREEQTRFDPSAFYAPEPQQTFAASAHPALPRETHSSRRETKSLSWKERAQLSQEDRRSTITTDEQGRKTGPYVDTRGDIRDYDEGRNRDKIASRNRDKKARRIAEDIRTYFNEHHGLAVPLTRTTEGRKEEFRSSGKVLKEAAQQAREKEKDLSYLTDNPEKAKQKAAEYHRNPNGYESDGQ